MLLDVGFLLVGLFVLYFGAEWLIRGASSTALGLGIRPLIVGLTVVALGTSFPEFMTNVLAALRGELGHGLAIGNILGSNIANIGLILGITLLMTPVVVARSTLLREFPIMLGVQVAFLAMALDGTISRLDGAILLLMLTGFMAYLIRDARRSGMTPGDEVAAPVFMLPRWRRVSLLLLGMAGLALGAHLMVLGAVNIAQAFEISTVVIGLTIVAIGTSLPELATSIIGVLRNEADLSVGNVIGSNLLNVLFVVGLVAVLAPLQVEPVAIHVHFPVMLAFCSFIALAWFGFELRRWHGVVLLVAFAGYMGFVLIPVL